MLGWLVVTEKLVAVPVVVQTTPPELVKPGSPLQLPEALYVLLSTKYASWAVAALRASAATRALKPRERYAENCGIAIAARMPMIATTTSSSISVKPFILERLRILSPCSGWSWLVPTPVEPPSSSSTRACSKRGARDEGRAALVGVRGKKPQIHSANGARDLVRAY